MEDWITSTWQQERQAFCDEMAAHIEDDLRAGALDWRQDTMQHSAVILIVIPMEDELLHTDERPYCDDPDCPCKDFGFDPLNLGPQNENKIIEAAMNNVGEDLPWQSNYHDHRCECPGCRGLEQDDYEYLTGTGAYALQGKDQPVDSTNTFHLGDQDTGITVSFDETDPHGLLRIDTEQTIYFLSASETLSLLEWLYEKRDVIWQMSHEASEEVSR